MKQRKNKYIKKIKFECGCFIQKGHLLGHMKIAKHTGLLNVKKKINCNKKKKKK